VAAISLLVHRLSSDEYLSLLFELQRSVALVMNASKNNSESEGESADPLSRQTHSCAGREIGGMSL
jgi:hypothetical protein